MDDGFQHYLDEYHRDIGIQAAHACVDCPDSEGFLAAHLPVFDLAAGSVAAYAAAITRAAPETAPRWRLDPERIAASFASDRLIRIDGQAVSGFSEYSGFFTAADGWVRTHGNYPHHRDRLLAILGLDSTATTASVAQKISSLDAVEVEQRAVDAGAIAVRVRTEAQWRAGEQSAAARSAPLVTVRTRGTGSATPRSPGIGRPLDGIRVLDLTRVIAGPVATRALALLGADVLRIDPPAIPEIEWQHLDNGQGKRSTLLDLKTTGGHATFLGLLEDADVLVTGYRPGALEALLGQELPGHLVHGRVSAWGWDGPWADRRGFDSIVQAASGISFLEGGERPGALPAQALDHATGYFLAAAIVDALTLRNSDGHGRDVDLALASTGARLLDAPGRTLDPGAPTTPGPRVTATHGKVTATRPALVEFDDYPQQARPWGADRAEWAHRAHRR
ncbi:hypothetical protein ABH922_002065 [Rhodococcus sp. 27YEA15]|uniref:CoA transferase n=1 Tax=Rhodococcus sp. 27YEA15 TaxID=3156259 RepID=UPI003C7BF3E1